MQHAESRHLATVGLEEDHAAELGDVGKTALFAQIPGDFAVGIGPHFDVAEELQDQIAAIANGGVALLGTAAERGQRHVLVPA